MSNKEAAEQCIEGGLDEGKHDPQEAIRLGLAGIGYALADVADAIREQTAAIKAQTTALNETMLNDGVRTVPLHG